MTDTKEPITIKGFKDGLVVHINEHSSFKSTLENIKKKFKASKSFFKSSDLKVNFDGYDFNNDEYNEILTTISGILKCDVSLWDKSENAEKSSKSENGTDKIIDKALDVFNVDEGLTRFYKKTIRSGQLVKTDGNMVVVGDVNPGAELQAAGNIIVMGTVKGIVHAGNRGNRNAIVVALNLSPTQLRIADIITRSPDEEPKNTLIPEIAYIKDDKIFIEQYLQKKK